MSASVIRSRCESTARHAGHMSLKRLRLSTSEYTERLVCRLPGETRGTVWGSQDFGRRSVSLYTSGQYRSRCRDKSLVQRSQHRSIAQARTFSTTASSRTNTSSSSTSSVSPDEVSHFSRLASTWWDPHGPSRLLHLMNPLRHDFIRSCLAQDPNHHPTPSSLSYLDIGCGGGIFSTSVALLRTTSQVTAIDPTPACILAAKTHARTDPALSAPPSGKLTYLTTSIEDLSTTYKSSLGHDFEAVDIITLFEVLEHIDHPSTFLTSAIQHLKPGGWLIGSTIARHPLSYIATKLIAEAPLIGVVPRGTHDWNKYINPDELKSWFEERAEGKWGAFRTQGAIYLPAMGWKVVEGSEGYGNYFFGVQKLE